jgi:hypothetical protein
MDETAFVEDELFHDPDGEKNETGVPEHYEVTITCINKRTQSKLGRAGLAEFNCAKTATSRIADN